jgi:hypothetical protein
MSSVFLSHNYKDKEFVRRLASDLRAYGVKVWVDEAEILVGDSLMQKIGEGIGQMEYVAVVLSPNSIDSNWVQREIEIATNREINGHKVKVLPILYRKCKMPPFLEGKLYADFTLYENYHKALEGLLKRLVPNYLIESELRTPKRSLQELELQCGAGVASHLTNLTGEEISASKIKVKISENATECDLIWENTLEADQLYRPIIDSSLTNPCVDSSSKDSSKDSEPQSSLAEWIQKLQSFELALLEKLGATLDPDELHLDQTLKRIWHPYNLPPGMDSTVLASALYWRARFDIGEVRYRYLYPNDQRNPFELLTQLQDDNLYFVGMRDDGTFVFYSPPLVRAAEEFVPLTPILIDQKIIPSLPRQWSNHAQGFQESRSKNRIVNRLLVLNLQVFAAGVALARHFGYWQRCLVTYERLYTGYDSSKFASLLRVASHSLRQMRELTSDDDGNKISWLPSFDISSMQFDSTSSMWRNDGMVMVTRCSTSGEDKLCVDPVLDIQLINYADEPCIISEFIFRHYGTWYDARPLAGAFYGTLESAHTYNVEVDFDRDITNTSLDPPFFMGAKSPGRFKVRLLNFREILPGHYAFVQFGFKSRVDVCDTGIFCVFTK